MKKIISKVYHFIYSHLNNFLIHINKKLPLKNQIVASSFYGKIYGNNTKYVIEKLHEINPKIKIYWICEKNYSYSLPTYVTPIKSKLRSSIIYARSKVVLDTHFIPRDFYRRDNQIYIMMYHGGLGMKKIANSVPGREKGTWPIHNGNNASLFVSNSFFINSVIRECLYFNGPIWMVGYPKNDLFHSNKMPIKEKVFNFFHLNNDDKMILYAPTYRLDKNDVSVFDIDFEMVIQTFQKKFNGNWLVVLHLHPHQQQLSQYLCNKFKNNVIDGNNYEDIQELMLSCDSLISDYSSCIFEAAEASVPCFIYASDWKTYKEKQGFFFDLCDLPFPYAENNDDFKQMVLNYDYNDYFKKWKLFSKQQGLIETDKSSITIAKKINEYLKDGKLDLSEETIVL